jgi:hypothetical protein
MTHCNKKTNMLQKMSDRSWGSEQKSESSATNLLQRCVGGYAPAPALAGGARANQNGAFCGLRAATWS